MKLAMVIDSSRCIDCKACMVSCSTANSVPAGQHRNWVKVKLPDYTAARPGGHFQPGACMHCQNPTCVEACPSGATYRRQDTGEVVIDEKLCIGCGNCMPSCPYGARYIHEKRRVADKCDYCASRRAQGLDPACVGTCPTRARVFGDLDDPGSEAARRLAKNYSVSLEYPGVETRPAMYYVKETAPMNWPRNPEVPVSMRFLTDWAGPAVNGLVGLAGIGLLAALTRGIIMPDKNEKASDDTAPEQLKNGVASESHPDATKNQEKSKLGGGHE